ncbi:hypothetical protein BJX76DRAFT_362122 [Aspergillus varians]
MGCDHILNQAPSPVGSPFFGISPLSVMSNMMAGILRAQPRFLTLTWFGGRHVDRTESGLPVDEPAMARSLIDQLLRQYDFNMQQLPHPVDSVSSEGLIQLMDWLIHQLPLTYTLCCIVDGVALLERDNDLSVAAVIKLLMTSMPATTTVRAAFDEEGQVLNVGALRQLGLPPSEDRMARELSQYNEGHLY